ncbi:hypothetical protein [Burkholderia vietnamiensis]|uniref:hypothetical protein n=1 Tax=Burkholderia vietnamiensis TaxID=60552 RepID=UPI00158B5353|nr:hypothetical protein [Burkholderia vietnamiensis]
MPYSPKDIDLVIENLLACREDLEASIPGIKLSRDAIAKALNLHARVVKSGGLPGSGHVNPSAPSKSALLLRILSDKQPLRFRPPTSHSYPHYELVEEPEVRNVVLGGPTTLGSMLNGTGGAPGNTSMVVNQCLYALVGMNSVAEEIMTMLLDDESFNGRKFLELADQSPIWTLKHGEWPAWELTTGLSPNGAGLRYAVDRPVPAKRNEVLFGGWGAPINPIVVVHGEDRIASAKARKAAAMRADSSMTGVERMLALDESDVYPGHPSQYDLLNYTRRVWVMRKSAEWEGFEIPYLDA